MTNMYIKPDIVDTGPSPLTKEGEGWVIMKISERMSLKLNFEHSKIKG